jgi:predicted methyltransferase
MVWFADLGNAQRSDDNGRNLREVAHMRLTRRLAGLGLVLALAACSERQQPQPAATPEAAPAPPPAAVAARADYAAAVATPGRLASDREQDSSRKPAEVLEFFGVQPGMSVLDLYAGRGYFTELLAAVVGPTGRVVAHNNTPYLSGTTAEWSERMADPQRLTNVERLTAENNELDLAPAQFDFALLSAVYHDVYFADEANGWAAIDGPKLLAELLTALKPGAKIGLIDHAAAPAAPAETGGTLHRIDPELVKRDFAAAGFVLEAESDVLRNPADDLSKAVYDPAVRGRTDRFMLRFRRP